MKSFWRWCSSSMTHLLISSPKYESERTNPIHSTNDETDSWPLKQGIMNMDDGPPKKVFHHRASHLRVQGSCHHKSHWINMNHHCCSQITRQYAPQFGCTSHTNPSQESSLAAASAPPYLWLATAWRCCCRLKQLPWWTSHNGTGWSSWACWPTLTRLENSCGLYVCTKDSPMKYVDDWFPHS